MQKLPKLKLSYLIPRVIWLVATLAGAIVVVRRLNHSIGVFLFLTGVVLVVAFVAIVLGKKEFQNIDNDRTPLKTHFWKSASGDYLRPATRSEVPDEAKGGVIFAGILFAVVAPVVIICANGFCDWSEGWTLLGILVGAAIVFGFGHWILESFLEC